MVPPQLESIKITAVVGDVRPRKPIIDPPLLDVGLAGSPVVQEHSARLIKPGPVRAV